MLSSGVLLENGVYQGSPLGPLLFILYINDIVRIHENVFCNIYAEDTVLVYTDKDVDKAVAGSMDIFGKIEGWCTLNNIRVNTRKTKHMLVGGNVTECGSGQTLNNKGVITVENYTYLGVNVDRKLNFEKFISNTISRVQGRLITLARLRKYLDLKTALLIYKQTILPILDYSCFLIESSTQRKIKRLQPIQNRAIRTVKKLRGYISTEEMEKLHTELHLQLLSDRRKRFMLMLMYKLSRDDMNVNTHRPDRILRTGPKVKLKVPFTDKERVLRSPYYVGSRLWDRLDVDFQRSNNIWEF